MRETRSMCSGAAPASRFLSRLAVTAVIIASLPIAHGESATGANFATDTTVVAIVNVPSPGYAPRALIISTMRDSVPTYENVPGLGYKVFTLSQQAHRFGGIYTWKDQVSAEQWFTPDWFARVKRDRGVDATLRYFDAPVTINNEAGERYAAHNAGLAPSEISLQDIASGTPSLERFSATPVATVVLVKTPASVSRQQLIAEFTAAVPTYQTIKGLLRKHFIISRDGRFGGVYIWADEASARAWFNPAWQQKVQATYGAAAIEWYDAPVLLPGKHPAEPARHGHATPLR
jgi:heme-degrading monooxygenase HmoA